MAIRKKKAKTVRKKDEPIQFASDMELLDYLKQTIVSQIRKGTIKLKVGDLLKILEIQKELSTDASVEEKFWEIIEEIRQKELDED